VEELFSLAGPEASVLPPPVPVEVLSAQPAAKGAAMRLCRVGDRLVGVPVQAVPYQIPESDGVMVAAGGGNKADRVAPFAAGAESYRRITVAGCDPAAGLVARMAERQGDGGLEIVNVPGSSKLVLDWLQQGKVHIAGAHIEDTATGEFNLPYLRRQWPREDFAVVSFARWEEGLVTAPGNPLGIQTVSGLTRRGVRFVNREPGSGSRALLDQLLADAGVPTSKVHGYERVAYGHLAAAYLVHTGDADCCLATRSAANAFHLDFVPLRAERYDFVLRRETLDVPAVQTFLDVLQRASLRRKLEVLAGYDTSQTGAVLA
jgi:molybdate-binding protein